MSTRLTSSCGNMLISGTPVTLAPTTRWPSSSVSVRIAPTPRSEKELRPCAPLEVLKVLTLVPLDPYSDGNCAIALKTFGCALAVMALASTTVVGVGAVKPLVVMRDPVTTMSCALVSSSRVVGGVALL